MKRFIFVMVTVLTLAASGPLAMAAGGNENASGPDRNSKPVEVSKSAAAPAGSKASSNAAVSGSAVVRPGTVVSTNEAKKEGDKKMKIQLIRNATMKITYAGKTILADPMLSPKGAMDPFAGIARNPTVELPSGTEEILAGVDGVLVTHSHPDHFDKTAGDIISKELPIICQPEDEAKFKKEGFKTVISVGGVHTWNGITITRTGGSHGSGKILEMMGKVSGFVLQAAGEPAVYWIGDSIWCEEVESAIKKYDPDIIITHSGGANIPRFDPILMDAAQTIGVVKASSKARVAAIHMESLDHCVVTRKGLREAADKEGIPASRLIIPNDGETISF